ncbi:DUF732 domain-containing protein [Mycolicibacterium palauense]|uniref:DUF732 domain-containing protein n=1 Tax=Mycolicibacterium palauense TaxID=2034511 RepID=UPI003898EE66
MQEAGVDIPGSKELELGVARQNCELLRGGVSPQAVVTNVVVLYPTLSTDEAITFTQMSVNLLCPDQLQMGYSPRYGTRDLSPNVGRLR